MAARPKRSSVACCCCRSGCTKVSARLSARASSRRSGAGQHGSSHTSKLCRRQVQPSCHDLIVLHATSCQIGSRVVAINAALGAFAKSLQWAWAMCFLHQMLEGLTKSWCTMVRGVSQMAQYAGGAGTTRPDVVSLSTSISACVARQTQELELPLASRHGAPHVGVGDCIFFLHVFACRAARGEDWLLGSSPLHLDGFQKRTAQGHRWLKLQYVRTVRRTATARTPVLSSASWS